MTEAEKSLAFLDEVARQLEARGELVTLFEAKCVVKKHVKEDKECLPFQDNLPAKFRIYTYTEEGSYYLATLDKTGSPSLCRNEEYGLILGVETRHQSIEDAKQTANDMYGELFDWEWKEVGQELRNRGTSSSNGDQPHLNLDQGTDDLTPDDDL